VLTELGDGVYVLEIPGPIPVNAGIVVGDESVAVIDTGTVESDAKQQLDAVARVTDLPVRYVINTHHHGDHSFGNWWFLPAVVVGHDRCRLRLVGEAGERHREMMARLVPAAAEQVQAVPVTAPAVTFDRSCDLHLGNVSLRLDYLGRAHTDNDITVRLTERDLVFAGDLIEQSAPPVVIEGFPAEWGPTLRALEAVPEARFIPGHGVEVNSAFVGMQAQAFEQIAETCRAAGSAGAALDALGTLPHSVRAVLGAQAQVAVARYFATVQA
jgi:glyoxylase-like metal-dependent hydrolase (beta-lactamase superfamily II)